MHRAKNEPAEERVRQSPIRDFFMPTALATPYDLEEFRAFSRRPD